MRPRSIIRRSGLLCLLVLATAWTPAAEARDLRLIRAVQDGDLAAVKRLLTTPGIDVNAPQGDGATAMHWAAHRNNLDVLDQLVTAGARADVANEYGVTPIMLASTNGSAAAISRLLKAGAKVNRPLPTGETPLMTAARVGRLDAVRALVDAGADINAAERLKGQTALMWAISESHDDVAEYLLGHGADPKAKSLSGFSPLLFAARMGDLPMIKLLLAKGANINEEAADGSTPLLITTIRGHADVALYMLDNGAFADPDKTGFTPLHWAVGKWESEQTHDYPEIGGEWGSLIGIKTHKIELIKALLARGAQINRRLAKSPPRFGYAMFAQIKVVGGTPFWIAALSCDVEVMKLLVASGANPLDKSDEGVTPLMVAAGVGRVAGDSLISEEDSLAATKLCIELGGDVNAQADSTGYAALHGVAFYGLDNVARLLVEHGADLELKNKKGETPLKIAEGTVNQAMLVSHPSTAEVLRKLAAEKAARK